MNVLWHPERRAEWSPEEISGGSVEGRSGSIHWGARRKFCVDGRLSTRHSLLPLASCVIISAYGLILKTVWNSAPRAFTTHWFLENHIIPTAQDKNTLTECFAWQDWKQEEKSDVVLLFSKGTKSTSQQLYSWLINQFIDQSPPPTLQGV